MSTHPQLAELDRHIGRVADSLAAAAAFGYQDHPRAQSLREALAEARTLRVLLARQIEALNTQQRRLNIPGASLWHSHGEGWELAGLYLTRQGAHTAARLYRWSHPQHLWAVRPCTADGGAVPPRTTPTTDSQP